MPKPTKSDMAKYRTLLEQQLRTLTGDVGAMREEALRASEQDNSVDHLADQGTDNADQAFTLGLIENEAKRRPSA
jgi:RNA polymerase-binding transcription factor DksA